MGAQMPTLEAAVDARKAKSGADQFTAATNQMAAGAQKAGTASDVASQKVAKLGTESKKTSGFMAGFGGGLASTASIHLVNFVRNTLKSGEAMKELSDRTGLSVESLSTLQYQTKLSGGSVEGVATGIKAFSRVLTDAQHGSATAAEKLKILGITAKDFDPISKNLDLGIAKIGRGLNALPTATEKQSAAMDALGKSGADLIPFFADLGDRFPELRAQLEATGQIMTTDFANAADAVGDGASSIGVAFQGLLIALAPVITKIAEGIIGIGAGFVTLKAYVTDGLDWDAAVAKGAKFVRTLDEVAKSQKDAGNTAAAAAVQTDAYADALKRLTPVRTDEQLRIHAAEDQRALIDRIGAIRDEIEVLQRASKSAGDHADALQAERQALSFDGNAGKDWLKIFRQVSRERDALAAEAKARPILTGLEVELRNLRALPTVGVFRSLAKEVQDLSDEFDTLNEGVDSQIVLQDQLTAVMLKRQIQAEEGIQQGRDIRDGLRQENALILLSTDAREKAQALREFDDATVAARGDARTKALRDELEVLVEQKQALERLKQAADDYARAITDGLENAILGADGLTSALKGVYEELIKISFRTFVSNPLNNLLSGLFSGAGAGLGLFGSAKGNVFQGGAPRAFASGGVVDRQTYFGLSNGRTGVMGEAGPEGILPLKRDARGRLGVTAVGGGATTVVQNFYIRTNDAGSFRASKHQWANDVKRAARDA